MHMTRKGIALSERMLLAYITRNTFLIHERDTGHIRDTYKRIYHHTTKVVIACGTHLFPFRTESLNHTAPMVLHMRESR